MVDPGGRYAIIFNGEIYNYLELRAELERTGTVFRSSTDTEVLLNLFAQHGIDSLRRVVGMYAFAFLDRTTRRVWVVRDPFGIKPLFYATGDSSLAFASEIQPLLDIGFGSRVVEPGPLFRYLRHAVTDHGEATLVRGVRQLRPAHALEIDADTGQIVANRRFWQPSLQTRAISRPADAADEFRSLFEESVRLHLRADVPVAATLSGGLDSSAIVSVAAHHQRLGVFSYIADDPVLGEEPYVDTVTGALNVTPEKIRLCPDQLAAELDDLIVKQGQPFMTTSIWAQSRVFRRVRECGFKVVLDGQGADELFGGYPVFRAARLTALLRRGEIAAAVHMLKATHDAMAVLQSLGHLLPRSLKEVARHLVRRPTVPEWLDDSWVQRHSVRTDRPFERADADSDLLAQLYDAAVATSLPMLLRYADRNAMAVSLENRVPFLTTRLAEFAFSLPDNLLIDDEGVTKAVVRRALRGLVPDRVLDRRDKIGFMTPEQRWFSGSPALRALLRQVSVQLPRCFSPQMSSRFSDVAVGRRPYTAEIWRAWNVTRWVQLMRLDVPQ